MNLQTLKENLNLLSEATQLKSHSPQSLQKAKNRLFFEYRQGEVLEWGKFYFPDKFKNPFCKDLHEYFVKVRKEPQTVTLAPRGYAKTTIRCFLIPLFQAMNEPDEFQHYLSIQSTARKAIGQNLSIRIELESNELLRKDYGDLTSAEKWTEHQFVLKNDIIFTAVGAGDSIRGLNYRNQRPDYITIDDLYNDDDLYSVDAILKKNAWLSSTVYKCSDPSKRTCLHIQGTAFSRSDFIHLRKKNYDWLFKKFQAIKNWDEKEVLWPEVKNFTFENLLKDRIEMGDVTFMREMQNDCRDDANSRIKLEWIRYYKELPHVQRWVWSWDTAIKPGTHNDYTVGLLWAVCETGFYLVDMIREKIAYGELKQRVKMAFDSQPGLVLIEDKASGQQLLQDFRRSRIVTIAMRPGKDMGLHKEERVDFISCLFESGKVFFPEGKPWTRIVVDEVIYFESSKTAIHDDIVDAITQFLSRELKPQVPKIFRL